MKTRQVSQVRIILYPQHRLSRTVMHTLATVAAALLAIRIGLEGPWWWALAAYLCTFVGTHVVAVPVMTAWRASLDWIERRIRSIVEEELIAFDLRTYERQFRRVFPSADAPPDEPRA